MTPTGQKAKLFQGILMLKKRYQLLLLATLVLAIYYPATFAGYSRIDDYNLKARFEQKPDITFKNILKFPDAGIYYRPVNEASYLFDKLLFNLDPGMMHLENILFHLVNAILVYLLTRRVLPRNDREKSYLPLIAAALFGLHPINSESVSWISGRSDPLTGIFLLTSTLFLLKFRDSHEKKHLIFSATAFLLGVLTKEVAYAFLPGALLILNAGENGNFDAVRKSQQSLQNRIVWLAGAAAVFFIIVRYYNAAASRMQIGMTFSMLLSDPLHTMFIVLRTFGFYLKKLVIPYPLNAFIMEIDPLYQIAAIPLVMMCIYIASRRTVASALFVTGILLITPAFIIVFKAIAWAPFAERYLYIPSAFFVTSATLFLSEKLKYKGAYLKRAVIAGIILVMAVTTLQRASIWQGDSALIEDTIVKSPKSKEMRVQYGAILIERGDYDNAVEQLTIAQSLDSYIFSYDARPELFIAYIRYKQERFNEALTISENVLEKTKGRSVDALNMLHGILWTKQRLAKTGKQKHALNQKLFDYNQMLFKLSNDPFISYRLGMISMNLGNRKEAIKFFQQAGNSMSDDDPYKKVVKAKVEKLAGYGQ